MKSCEINTENDHLLDLQLPENPTLGVQSLKAYTLLNPTHNENFGCFRFFRYYFKGA